MSGKVEFRDDALMTGEFPAFIWKWTNLERFQLKFSGITSVDLTGIENMVNLTEYNTEGNAIGGTVPAAIFTLPAMEKIYIHNCEYDALPAELTSASGLSRLYFNGNSLTDLPDMSGITWGAGAKVRVQDNNLTFEDLEGNVALSSNADVAEFNYSPQATVGVETYQYPDAGSMVVLASNVGGSDNVYTWIQGAADVVASTTDLTIDAFDAATNSGRYSAIVQSGLVPGLDISVVPQKLFASVQAQDSLALVALHNTNGGTGWTGYDTWLNGPLNTWEGVTIDSASQRVVNVNFKDMELVGTLVQDIEDITEMSGKIEFRDDALMTGEFPSFIWKWTKVDRFQLKFSGITSVDLTGIENMVNLTEYNTEGNAIGGTAPAAVFALPAMEKVYLHNCEYDALPAELTSTIGLSRLYFNGNSLSDLPDMSSMTWGAGAKIRVQDNQLTFEDLEGNVIISTDTLVAEFNYSPQANVGDTTLIEALTGDMVTMDAPVVGGSANIYTWVKGGIDVVGNESVYEIASVAIADIDTFFLLVQSTLVPGLDIIREPVLLTVDGFTSSIQDLDHFGEIKVMGNPLQHTLSIQADEIIERVIIHSIDGQQMSNQAVNNQQINLPVSDLTPGLYLVTLESEGQFITLKVVKE